MVRLANFVTGHKLTAGTMTVWVDQDELLLVRSKHGERLWGFPGGVLGRHEQPADGACRELREETGLRLDARDLALVGTHVQPHGRHLDIVFRVVERPRPADAASLSGEDHFEIAETGWFPLDALPALRSEAQRAVDLYPALLG
jgi:ADP-ribose pyrophosphatase YjhB (NUDIX family)